MTLALVVVVGVLGVGTTVFAAARMWRATRRGAPRELVLGYLALMLAASIVSVAILKLL